MESLAKLNRVQEGRLRHRRNASGICDGASSLVIADGWAEARGLSPIPASSVGVSGCDPNIMGIGPVPATRRALEMTGLDSTTSRSSR